MAHPETAELEILFMDMLQKNIITLNAFAERLFNEIDIYILDAGKEAERAAQIALLGYTLDFDSKRLRERLRNMSEEETEQLNEKLRKKIPPDEMLKQHKIAMLKAKSLSVYGRSDVPPIDKATDVIFTFLKKFIRLTDDELSKDEDLKEGSLFLNEFKNILNERVAVLINNSGGSYNIFSKFKENSEYYSARLVAEAAIGYINAFYDLEFNFYKDRAPVGICPQCDGIFHKTRVDQMYCTKSCKFAMWAKQKGKEYFIKKIERNNAAKKNKENT